MRNFKSALLAGILAFSFAVNAQPGNDNPMQSHERSEKVEAMKVAFLTQKLSLTVEEAKVFWPVYDQYQSELKALRDKRREQITSSIKNSKELSDKEYENLADAEIEFRQQELDIMKKYHVQLKTVISGKKLAQLYKSENDFKRELLRQIQDKNRESGNRSPSKRPDRN